MDGKLITQPEVMQLVMIVSQDSRQTLSTVISCLMCNYVYTFLDRKKYGRLNNLLIFGSI